MIRITRTSTVFMAVVGLLVLTAGPALAEISLTVAAPAEATIGGTVPVIVTVTEDGVPVPDAIVTLSRNSSFAGVSDYMEIVRATTGEDGTVDLSYVQRAAEETVNLRIEVIDSDVEPLEFAVTSVGEAEQVFEHAVGIDLPGRGGFVLIALMAGLWGIILSTVLRLRSIAAEESDTLEEPEPKWRVVPYALPGVVVVIAVVLVTVLVRNPATFSTIDGAGGAGRVPLSLVGEFTSFESPSLDEIFAEPTGDVTVDGSRAFFGLGCASCHGLDGVSGVVGGDISSKVEDGFGEFLDKVRRGPKGMPEYAEDVFSDDELAAVHAYLETLLSEESQAGG